METKPRGVRLPKPCKLWQRVWILFHCLCGTIAGFYIGEQWDHIFILEIFLCDIMEDWLERAVALILPSIIFLFFIFYAVPSDSWYLLPPWSVDHFFLCSLFLQEPSKVHCCRSSKTTCQATFSKILFILRHSLLKKFLKFLIPNRKRLTHYPATSGLLTLMSPGTQDISHPSLSNSLL